MTTFLYHLPKGKSSWSPIEPMTDAAKNPCIRVLFVEEGAGECKIENQTLQANTSDLFLIASHETCDLSDLSDTDRWILNFDMAALSNANIDTRGFLMLMSEEPLLSFLSSHNEKCQPTTKRRFKADKENRLCWATCLRQLSRELSEKSFGYADVIHSLLKLLLFDIVRLVKLRFKAKSPQPLVAKALNFIEENYKDAISLSDVAAAVERSPAYLTDLVRQTTGKTVLGWIVEHRMAHARQLLLYTSHSVAHISEQVGYFDRRHFSRQFLRSHNLTPHKWRHKNAVSEASNAVGNLIDSQTNSRTDVLSTS